MPTKAKTDMLGVFLQVVGLFRNVAQEHVMVVFVVIACFYDLTGREAVH
jgi:hypothetical protein